MKRVLLKLSGEALAGEKKTGFDEETCLGVARQVKKLVDKGIQVDVYKRQLLYYEKENYVTVQPYSVREA